MKGFFVDPSSPPSPLNLPLNTSKQMLPRLLETVVVWVFFSTNWSFRVYLKKSCNKKLLKFGITEVGKIKMQTGKERTHSKCFPENKIFESTY